jgi:streptogramin lyase/anti-sigma regulatory factor (Ser/Thr protein kinase)
MRVFKYGLFALLFLAARPVAGQPLFSRYTRYTTRDGLSHPYVTCLAKDGDGFLWAGTREGLCRFDGDRFEIMLKNSSSNSISNNRINCITLLNKKLLFAGTAYGLNIINIQTLEVKNVYFNGPAGIKDRTNNVVSMMINPTGGVWVNLYNGIALVDSAGKILKQMLLIANNDSLTNKVLQRIVYIQPNGTPVCINNYYRFLKPNFNTGKFENDVDLLKGTVLEKTEYSNLLISSISNTAGGLVNIVFGERRSRDIPGQILQVDPLKHTSKIFKPTNSENDKRYYQVCDINDSLMLVTSFFGRPVIYNKHSAKSILCTEPAGFFSSWPDGLGNCFLKDGNNFWIGTNNELFQIKMGAPAFENVAAIDSILNNQPSLVNVGDVKTYGDSLTVTCMGTGVLIVNQRTGKCRLYSYPAAESRYSVSNFSFFKNAASVWNASIYGLTSIDLKTGKTAKLPYSYKATPLDSGVNVAFTDSKNNLWCTRYNRIFRLLAGSQSFEEILPPKNAAGNNLMDAVADINEDEHGNMYFGGYKKGGICKYDPFKKTWETVIASFEYKDFSSAAATNMTIFKNNIYLHTGGAFAELNLLTKEYHIYTKIDGISTTGINAIAADKNGYVWIATTNGLNSFNPFLKNFTTYYMQDGLPSDNISATGMLDTSTNLMFIGTEKAFRFFKPGLLLGEKRAPAIIITGIKNTQGEKLKILNNTLDLPYSSNDVEIEYTGINFDNGSLNKYAYRLKGKDDEWIEAGNKKIATYTNLPPGSYLFEVKSANRQGIWNNAPALLTIVIKPPFWQTWWFYLLSVIILTAAILFIFYLQHVAAKKREAENIRITNQLNELRMKALRSQLNPHFIFNALNSIQSYVMDNNTMEASRYLSKFAKLFRLVLENTDANFTTLQNEISLLSHYIELEALRFNHHFTFEITTAAGINVNDISVPSMLLQPHVENAVLHGLSTKKNSRLTISFTWHNERSICCKITDNGIGRKKAAELKKGKFKTHESKGLTILEQRTQILETQYNLQSSYAIKDIETTRGETGTEVTVLLPVKTVEIIT